MVWSQHSYPPAFPKNMFDLSYLLPHHQSLEPLKKHFFFPFMFFCQSACISLTITTMVLLRFWCKVSEHWLTAATSDDYLTDNYNKVVETQKIVLYKTICNIKFIQTGSVFAWKKCIILNLIWNLSQLDFVLVRLEVTARPKKILLDSLQLWLQQASTMASFQYV